MRRWLTLMLSGSLALAARNLPAAAQTQARLLLAAESARPGQTVWAGVQLRMAPGWHTYWWNPGESGAATAIAWTLPPGITAGAIQWPPPAKLTDLDLTTYVYKQEVVLLVPLTLASNLGLGKLELKAKVSWLECEQLCVPGSSEVSASLNISLETKASASAALLAAWQNRLPKPDPSLQVKAAWDAPAAAKERPVILSWAAAGHPAFADFYAYPSKDYEVQPAVTPLPADGGQGRLRLVVKKLGEQWPAQIAGLLVATNATTNSAVSEVTLDLAPLAVATAPAATAAPPQLSLALMLLYAFVGGLILNIMPCVLPVIALKILGFVNQSKESPGRVRKMGLLYGAGVLVSFLMLAMVVVGIQSAGHKAGWGMQLANPQFVVFLTVLVTLVALNLFGLFEVNPSGRVLEVAGDLSAKEGGAGAFFNGVLATVLATPCTAPFLGAAVGFAFVQKSSAVLLLIFLCVGLGLAAPYILLSWNPAWLRFLPRPGAWMQKFKIAMGFPMLATAIWLFNLLPRFYGKRTVLWFGLFLVLIALTAWLYGELIQRGRRRKGWAAALIVLLLVFDYGYVLEGQLRWRAPATDEAQAAMLKEDPEGINWHPWSLAAVAQARAEGRPVFVDFTADWCFTCQANKRSSIEISSVRAKLKAINAVALLGDYTTQPPEMTDELNRHNRAGVPLVLVYPKEASQPPIVLPEVLTPGRVLAALDQAAR